MNVAKLPMRFEIKRRQVMASKPVRFLVVFSALFSIIMMEAGGTAAEPTPPHAQRTLYAVNEAPRDRGSISVYDIDAGHRLIRTIETVPGVADVRGVAASAVTGKLYVAYMDAS